MNLNVHFEDEEIKGNPHFNNYKSNPYFKIMSKAKNSKNRVNLFK